MYYIELFLINAYGVLRLVGAVTEIPSSMYVLASVAHTHISPDA